MDTTQKSRLQDLANKWLKGILNDAEQLEFDKWLSDVSDDPIVVPADVAESREVHKLALFNKIQAKIRQQGNAQQRTVRVWPGIVVASRSKIGTLLIAAAAIAAIVFGAGLFYYKLSIKQEQPSQIAYKNDIVPGKTGATLTLASGKKIRLSDAVSGELARETGVMITKSASGQLVYEIKGSETEPNKTNTLSTAKGETYQVRLPDGSLVWLNSASSLTYSATLNDKHGLRRVKLDGEGYFEIVKDESHPFVVESKGQEVEVLGTHFNINSYDDEDDVKTTLLEGRVRVARAGNAPVLLSPGEQAVNDGRKINLKTVVAEDVIAWKNGMFVSRGQEFKSTMRAIGRWYNIEVIFDYEPKDLHMSVQVSRSRDVTEILKSLERTEDVKFKIEGRRIRVIK